MNIDSGDRQNTSSLMGMWTWDLSTNHVQWSRNLYLLFGLDAEAMRGANLYDEFFKLVHPEDLESVRNANRQIQLAPKAIALAFRIVLPDGTVRRVVSEPDAMFGADGQVVSLTGIIRDLSREEHVETLLQQYKFALDQHSIVALTDRAGRITYVNDKACEISGYARDELLGNNHRILNSGFHDSNFFRTMYETIFAGQTWRGEIRNRRKDGAFYWVDTTIVPFKDAAGVIFEFLAIRTDISSRKKDELILADTARRLAEAQRLSKTGSWEWIPETGKVFWSDEMYRIFNINPRDFDGSTEASISAFHPDDRARVAEAAQRAMAERRPQPLDARVLLPDGSVRHVHGDAEILFDDLGNVMRIQGTYQDITDRVVAANRLQEANDRLDEAQQISGIGSWEWIAATNTMIFSKQMFQIWNISPEDFGGTFEAARNLMHDSERDQVELLMSRAIASRDTGPITLELTGPENTGRRVLAHVRLEFQDERLVRMVGTHQDITERIHMENALRQSRESYQRLFEQTADCLFLSDQEGNYLEVNLAATEFTGYSREELLGMNVRQLLVFGESEQPRFSELKAGWSLTTQRTIRKKSGELVQVEVRARMLSDGRFFASVRDLTPQRQLETTLLQAQKLESLALLAGGISHDFNNLLSGMFGYAELAHKLSKDERISHYLRRIIESLERSQNLTQRLMTFASGGHPRKTTGHLFPYVAETINFVLTGSNCRAQFDIAADLYPCEYDAVQIGQVFDNLVRNAQQAMASGGIISIRAKNMAIAEGQHPALAPGDYVRLSVEDTGSGISAENLPRLFDPFFSTKPDGHGLGLSSSYSIVKRHGGLIEVSSTEGKGSVFHAWLPALPDATVALTGENAAVPGAVTARRHILVMDDEDIVRESLSAMIDTLGYEVITVADGRAALEYLQRAATERRALAAVILDLTIPGGMGGKEVIAEMRKFDRNTPAFVSSGYSEGKIMADPVAHGFHAALPKPVRLADLAALLERFLGGG